MLCFVPEFEHVKLRLLIIALELQLVYSHFHLLFAFLILSQILRKSRCLCCRFSSSELVKQVDLS